MKNSNTNNQGKTNINWAIRILAKPITIPYK